MSRYRIEWQIGGEITIDTGSTDWTRGEVDMLVGQALLSAEDRTLDEVAGEFDDCGVEGDSISEYTIRELR